LKRDRFVDCPFLFSRILKGMAVPLAVFFISNTSVLSAAPVPAAKDIKAEGDALEKEWTDAKKNFKDRYDHLIVQTEQNIQALETALDSGDPVLRKKLTEDRKEMEKERDRLKRRLAELSAAHTVMLAKLKENIHDKIETLK
jgi:hypothetical protein